MGFFKKKEEKKKFDYSDDTKELFAERDAFYAEQRRKLGGGDSNPELANQTNPEAPKRDEDLGDLLGDSDFNPYVNQEETGESTASSIPAIPQSANSSSSTCQSCGKEFQSSEFSKCPMCGGDMKKTESAPAEPTPSPASQPDSTPTTSIGDPLDDLLGDFNSPAPEDASSDDTEDSDPGVRTASDDLGTDFGQSRSSHSNRKVRKVKKIKRPRKSL